MYRVICLLLAMVGCSVAQSTVSVNLGTLSPGTTGSGRVLTWTLKNCTASPTSPSGVLDTATASLIFDRFTTTGTIRVWRNDTQVNCAGVYTSYYTFKLIASAIVVWGYIGGASCGSSIVDNVAAITTGGPYYNSPYWNGAQTADGSVTWTYYGKPCPTNGSWTMVMDAVDNDLINGSSTLLGGDTGYPAIFHQTIPDAFGAAVSVPFFSDWSAGTVTDGGLCSTLPVGCGTYQSAPTWVMW